MHLPKKTPRAAGARSAGRLGLEGLWPGRPPASGRPDGQAPDGWQGERLPKKRLERRQHGVPVGSDKSGCGPADPRRGGGRMGKPQMDGRESGCRKTASRGRRTKCRAARTRRVTILGYLLEDSVTFSKKLSKEERMEAHPFIAIAWMKVRKSAGGQNGRHSAT